jgi:hypothetical protein
LKIVKPSKDLMAEIIAFTASLITLAGVGAKLAETLRNVVNTLRSAEYEVGLIAADISIFACSLTQLSKIISNREIPEAKRLHEIVDVLIPACSALIDELKKLIGDPMDFRMKHSLWMRVLSIRFKWLVQGPKVAFIKSLVESFKSTLIFLVSTMDLAVVIHQDAQYEVRYVRPRFFILEFYMAKFATGEVSKCKFRLAFDLQKMQKPIYFDSKNRCKWMSHQPCSIVLIPRAHVLMRLQMR